MGGGCATDADEWYTVEEAARMSGLSAQHIRKRCARGAVRGEDGSPAPYDPSVGDYLVPGYWVEAQKIPGQ
jgi:hypothetical protein